VQTNKGYDFSRDRSPRTYRGYLLLFDIEEKQSVVKINGGSNHCHHARRSWGCRKEPTLGITGSENFYLDIRRS
jgi:hypothetical protein